VVDGVTGYVVSNSRSERALAAMAVLLVTTLHANASRVRREQSHYSIRLGHPRRVPTRRSGSFDHFGSIDQWPRWNVGAACTASNRVNHGERRTETVYTW